MFFAVHIESLAGYFFNQRSQHAEINIGVLKIFPIWRTISVKHVAGVIGAARNEQFPNRWRRRFAIAIAQKTIVPASISETR